MAERLGIGIVTYNRVDILRETLNRVRAHTTMPSVVVVADDGSDDGTVDALRAQQVIVATGSNMGIAWNKNRALFLLSAVIQCDVVILLEDDSFPTEDGWEGEWVTAAERWGHANLGAPWLSDSFINGSGTVDDPYLSLDVTAQCSSFSRAALLYAGFFDPRFRGYGWEHLEHTRRLLRVGYGGTFEDIEGEVRPIFKLLKGSVEVLSGRSFSNPADRNRNELICRQLLFDEAYRMPWRDDTEMAQFRAEMQAALATA
jgi:GT2 family glycosyltransferase